ncbi:MAG: type II secretion system F family protein [Patescibacteria group bacterium]
MRFHYIASQPDGRIVEGEFEGQGTAEVLEFLASRGLRPVSLKAIKSLQTGVRFFGAGINLTDKVFMTKYLSLMLKVGTDLFRAIDILISDFDKPALKSILGEVKANLEKGQPFYVTFAKHPNIFDRVFVNLVKAGEASGNLDKIFEDLSNFLKKQQDLRSRIKSALVYPIILSSLSFIVLILLVTYALPQIAGVFEGSGFNPPVFSRLVFSIGKFFNAYILYIFILIAGIVGGNIYFFKTSASFRMIILRMIRRLPAIRDVVQKIALQRFAATFSSLIKAGLPILDAIEITASAVGNEDFKNALLRISREGITRGLTIGEAFHREPVFPRVVTNLIAISEKAGHIEDVLATLAGFYESEIDNSIKTLVSFLEPALLFFIGIAIGGIALAIIVPIYQLVTKF